MNTPKVKHMPSMKQQFDLYEWVKNHPGIFDEFFASQIASMAAAELGFKVSDGTIRRIRNELGIKTYRGKASPDKNGRASTTNANKKELAVIRTLIESLNQKVDFLVAQLTGVK